MELPNYGHATQFMEFVLLQFQVVPSWNQNVRRGMPIVKVAGAVHNSSSARLAASVKL